MSKFCLGFIVAIGLVIGCGAADNTADSPKPEKQIPVRLIQVGKSDITSYRYHSGIFKDTKTGQEYIYAYGWEGGVVILKVEDDE